MPRASYHALGRTYASQAHDVKLRNGRLEPWREPELFGKCSGNSFYVHGCCLICWNEYVRAVDAPADWGGFFLTGRRPYAEYAEVDPETCGVTYTRLGIPAPVRALAVTPIPIAGETCTRNSEMRKYVYTYVNKFSEEGSPSLPSKAIMVRDGQEVNVAGIEWPASNYGITHANVYRTASAHHVTSTAQQTPGTEFLLVATIKNTNYEYRDVVPMEGLGPALETQKVKEPPEGLDNICAIEGAVRLAGTVGNKVCISENLQVYNWPLKYELHLDYEIVHMHCLDSKLYVSTTSTPYVIDVSNCDELVCTPVVDAGKSIPDICTRAMSSSIITPHGMVYVSYRGLILIDSSARWYILTSKWYGEEDWLDILPDTIRMGYYRGYIICVTDKISFILNIAMPPYSDMRDTELSTISERPIELLPSKTDLLYMLINGNVIIWDHGENFIPFDWISRELSGGPHPVGLPPLGNTWSPVSAKIRTSGVNFSLIDPLRGKVFTRTVMNENPFRLPRTGRHMWYKIHLIGVCPVEFFDMGTAHFTVNQGV